MRFTVQARANAHDCSERIGSLALLCYVPRMACPLPFPVLPPLVLLPGTLCDERVFAPLLTALCRQFHKLDARVTMTVQHASLRAAAEHVLATAPLQFALLGFSLGGLLALETTLLAPDRVLGLALLNLNPAPPPNGTHASRRAAVLHAQCIGHTAYLRHHLWPNYVAPAAHQNTALQDLLAAMANDLGHTAFDHQTEAALARRDYRPLLSSFTMPTLVQAGELDSVCPAAAQRELAEALPNAVFTPIPNAGHFALLEQQDAVAASVAAWFHTIVQQQQLRQETQ